MTIAIGHAMIFNWRRKRAEQRQDLACQRRRLAFERLEERCVPSAKPILSGAASLLLVDQPGNNLLATALSAGNGLGVSPLIVHDGSEPGSACQAKLIQVTDDTSRQDQNVLTTQPLKQSGQNAPLQGGDDVLTNSPELPTSNKGKRFSGSGREANISLVDGGDLTAVQGKSRPKDSFADNTKLQSAGFDVGSMSVSLGVGNFGPKAGAHSSQGKNFDVPVPPVGEHTIAVSLAVLADPVSDRQGAHPNVASRAESELTWEASSAWREETELAGSGGMVMRWLIGPRGPDAGAAERGSLNMAGLGVAVERSLNVNAGMGSAEHSSLGQVHPASVGKETPEMPAGHDNRLVEKPTNGMTTLASPPPIAEILADAGRAPAAELTRPYATVSIGIKALTREAAPWQDFSSPGTGLGQDLANRLPSPAPGILLGSDGSPSLPASESVIDLGLFQSDVAAAGRVSGDVALGRDTGTTSVYVANEESSVWTILTTYALVIVPRQRKYQATILVVDPDDATRDALSVGLVRAGYFVLPAANVRDAWGVFRTPNARIDLVLLDPNLPDVSGIHLCARLREISPTLPVMVCAGEVEPAEVAQLQQLGVRYYLRKPIAFEELLLTVKAILR